MDEKGFAKLSRMFQAFPYNPASGIAEARCRKSGVLMSGFTSINLTRIEQNRTRLPAATRELVIGLHERADP